MPTMNCNTRAPCSTRSWSVSEDSLKRYVFFASESCIQELLSASDSNRPDNGDDGWKVLALDDGVEISKHLVEARYIKDLDENLSIIRLRFGESSKPLFRNREFIVYERRETMDDGTLVVAVASLPKEIAAGLQPKQNNSIRGFLVQSGWVVEKLDDESCMVTYVVQLDPAGWLPKFFVNRFNTKLVMIIENLWKQAQACSAIPSITDPS
ncbi:START domain-containing protein [Cynara cardunculus var. scolymus]|uniref:START domain-containing protein n=1 Tax=Cynara cardunculus var. scolymus TaxID=59895 RepID=A0A124SI30_CYNCS|nr:START domain-containing protein [Cynara cardunculus var. scolymus]